MTAALLAACLAFGDSELFVYTENVVPCYRSELVREALTEPLDSLAARWPDNELIRAYLDELEAARRDLYAAAAVTVRTRDEGGLSWEPPCPSWALSRYQTPRELHPRALIHPVEIVRHLEYVARLAALDVGSQKRVPRPSAEHPYASAFLETTFVRRDVRLAADGVLTIRHVESLTPILTPVPESKIDWPLKITTTRSQMQGGVNVCLSHETTHEGAGLEAVLRALDVGTGIVLRQ